MKSFVELIFYVSQSFLIPLVQICIAQLMGIAVIRPFDSYGPHHSLHCCKCLHFLRQPFISCIRNLIIKDMFLLDQSNTLETKNSLPQILLINLSRGALKKLLTRGNVQIFNCFLSLFIKIKIKHICIS